MTATFRTFLSVVLGVVTVAAAEKAATYETGAQWLAAVLLGAGFFVALCAAGTAVSAVVWFTAKYALYERRLARRIAASAPPPSARHARPAPLPVRLPDVDPRTLTRDGRLVDYYGDDALTEARAAAAEAEADRPVRDGLTQPLTVVVAAGVTTADPTLWRPTMTAGAQRGRT